MAGSPIHLVDDVLREIFRLLRDTDPDEQWLSRWVTVGGLVSQLSSQWCTVALSDSSLWTDVFIGPSSSPRMARLALDRAVKHNLRVSVCVPKHMGSPLFKGFAALFDASIQLAMVHSSHWESLSVVSPSLPLRRILKMLYHVPLPKLHSMKLIRSDTGATLSCGPFTELNPVIFRHLVLDGAAIRPVDSSQFSGLQSLALANTDLRMLDGIRMGFLTSSTFPTKFTPSLTNIQDLDISALFLLDVPLILSLDPFSLVSLKLRGLSADNRPLHSGTLVSLLLKLLTESLRSLELTDIHSTAVELLFSSLRGRKFGGLQELRIVSTDLRLGGLLVGTEILRNTFPSLTELQV